ncbi:hypothetical protein OOK60_06850 [Trichothermofontia sichuanensis B231]|uniref:hypothetical protein n=1 Tax=Trichothermofontia sichuanensis TaxID=3045816 RepID=UPI002245336B|nr:hypothetical protein [Trichothermofontia sichuanensis]UZQ55783.1 hypothetical protein OOK60_06850 [Trichothermofontia sichuanensis B231]
MDLSPTPPYQVEFAAMPLAVYREVAAHLAQVTGVTTALIPPPRNCPFAYEQSQVGGLGIHYDPTATSASHARVTQILTYYGQRYGSFQVHPWDGVLSQASYSHFN